MEKTQKKLDIVDVEQVLELRVKACDKALSLIQSGDITDFTVKLIVNADDYFFTESASSSGKHHPAYANGDGGLLRHSIAVTMILNDILNTKMYPFTDREKDLLLCAALVHDIKKYGNGNSGRTIKYHPEEAVKFIKTVWDGELSEDEINYISDAVVSHMGIWGKELPKTDAQIVVHMADSLASKKHIIIDFDGAEESVTELIQETSPEPQDYKLPFGKHKGERLGDIPRHYLQWLAEDFPQKTHPAVKNAKKLLKS